MAGAVRPGLFAALVALFVFMPGAAWGLASNNIPLDSPMYLYMEKLSGFGLVDTDINGLKPFSKAEAARIVLEAEGNIGRLKPEDSGFVVELISRAKELIPREIDLYNIEEKAPVFDWNPVSSMRLRYVFLDGEPRNFTRRVNSTGGESFFGFSEARPRFPHGSTQQETGTEGTPLLENNEGVIYRRGSNLELRDEFEVFLTRYASAEAEPRVLTTQGSGDIKSNVGITLNKGYVKLGGNGLELEVGRDGNWFGQGFRGTTVLTDNAANLDMLKLSSPEPVDWPWFKRNVGLLKYALVVSRLSASGTGADLRRPWLAVVKLSVKPWPFLEFGLNFARQTGGPNAGGNGLGGIVQVGAAYDGSNTLGGLEFRWRLPWFRGTTVYWEYSGEDNRVFVPIVESHIAGIYVPRLTSDGRNDFRFEFYFGNPVAYTDYQFPEGYTNRDMVMGHSQGGDTKEYFTRFTHYFSARHYLAVEYFHTQRGRLGRLGAEAVEEKDAGRLFWRLPVVDNWDALIGYGYEDIRNFNLVRGVHRENQLARVDLSYRY